ncbi:3-hydroxybutyryl-CoA dehydratase [Condylostylus longicornis]|uniref:3-hydroxybutyryl-CoA dehydratase n=1 Tax=Condylostylus longicornis TaxID=2530218 RepID=UPI00244DE5BA|nr:3-hydroxybutyryl-CoA dehydratase [Condylostylus longicornis]
MFKVNKLLNNVKYDLRKLSTQNLSVPEITVTRRITQEDLNSFSSLCGDSNIIHSEDIPEEERYVHGAFLNSLISGIMGSKIPGPGSIVVSQKFKFPRKCRINQDIELNVKLIDNRKIMKTVYHIKQANNIVFQGEASLIRLSSLSKNQQ